MLVGISVLSVIQPILSYQSQKCNDEIGLLRLDKIQSFISFEEHQQNQLTFVTINSLRRLNPGAFSNVTFDILGSQLLANTLILDINSSRDLEIKINDKSKICHMKEVFSIIPSYIILILTLLILIFRFKYFDLVD